MGEMGVLAWFALNIRGRHEKTLSQSLRRMGYEVFLPVRVTVRHWCDRIKRIELPLFPGYTFCRLDLTKIGPILDVPGILSIVGAGRTPIPVPDQEIDSLQLALKSGLPAYPWPYLDVGQRVRIIKGPLAGLEGIYINPTNRHHVIVSVNLLRRSVAVEIDREWAVPLPAIHGSRIDQCEAKVPVRPHLLSQKINTRT